MRVLWTARRSSQSILKEINSEYSLEGLRLKLKLQYFSHLMRRVDSLKMILMLGKIEGKRRRGRQRMRWLDSTADSMDMNLSKLRAIMGRRPWQSTPVLWPGKSHGQRSLVGCSPWGRLKSDKTELLHFHFSLSGIGEGNGNPLQCSCLENPRDGGAWWAAVYGVAQSRTRLKRLSSSSSSSRAIMKDREAWHAAGHGITAERQHKRKNV